MTDEIITINHPRSLPLSERLRAMEAELARKEHQIKCLQTMVDNLKFHLEMTIDEQDSIEKRMGELEEMWDEYTRMA